MSWSAQPAEDVPHQDAPVERLVSQQVVRVDEHRGNVAVEASGDERSGLEPASDGTEVELCQHDIAVPAEPGGLPLRVVCLDDAGGYRGQQIVGDGVQIRLRAAALPGAVWPEEVDQFEVCVVGNRERVGQEELRRHVREPVRQQCHLLDRLRGATREHDTVAGSVLDDPLQVVVDEPDPAGVGREAVGDNVDVVVRRVLDDRLAHVPGGHPVVRDVVVLLDPSGYVVADVRMLLVQRLLS